MFFFFQEFKGPVLFSEVERPVLFSGVESAVLFSGVETLCIVFWGRNVLFPGVETFCVIFGSLNVHTVMAVYTFSCFYAHGFPAVLAAASHEVFTFFFYTYIMGAAILDFVIELSGVVISCFTFPCLTFFFFYGSITHATGRLAQTNVRGNDLLKIMGQESYQ